MPPAYKTDDDPPTGPSEKVPAACRFARLRHCWPTAALIVYFAGLCALGCLNGRIAGAAPAPGWNSAGAAWLASWIGQLIMEGFAELLRFLPLGFLAVLAAARASAPPARLCGSPSQAGAETSHAGTGSAGTGNAGTGQTTGGTRVGMPGTTCGVVARAALAAVFALGLMAVACGFAAGGVPAAWRLVIPTLGCLTGLWIGMAWLRGRRARMWLVPELAVPLLVFASAAVWLWHRAVEDQPLAFPPIQVTSTDKRHLVDLVKRHGDRSSPRRDMAQLELSSYEVNLLVAWWLRLDRPDRKAKAWLAEGAVTGQATLSASLLGAGRGYVNLRSVTTLAVDRGHLLLDLRQLDVGRLKMPGFALGLLSRMVTAAITEDPNMAELLACIDRLRVRAGRLEVAGNTETFRRHVLPLLLAKKAATPAVMAATRSQVRHLVALATQTPHQDWDYRLPTLIKVAFTTARARSGSGDPIVENRAAILALAILCGDRRMERLVGPAMDGDVPRAAHRRLTWVRLRDRIDWSKHFVIAGALTLLLDDTTIEAIGVFKETIDAGGGSGFSFADLMADRAGRLFALAATRDVRSARAAQARWTGDFAVADFFPHAADLPEDLSTEQLKATYGGVGGAGYLQVEQEINRRLEACPGLR